MYRFSDTHYINKFMHVATFGGFVISFSFLSLLCFQQDVFGEDGTPEESTPTVTSPTELIFVDS